MNFRSDKVARTISFFGVRVSTDQPYIHMIFALASVMRTVKTFLSGGPCNHTTRYIWIRVRANVAIGIPLAVVF